MIQNLVGVSTPYDNKRPPRAVFNASQDVLIVWSHLRDEDFEERPGSWCYDVSRSSATAFRLYAGYERLTVMTESDFRIKYPNPVFLKFLSITK